MRQAILVRGARQLLTLRGTSGPRRGTDLRNLGIIQDGAVLIVNGRIEDIGPSRRVENLARAKQAEEIDATGRAVMPGFIDGHTHLVSGPARLQGFEIAAAADSLAQARAIQELSPRALEAQTRHTMEAAVRHGTTTLESKSGFGLTEANELKILRVHAALQKQCIPLISTFSSMRIPPGHPEDPDRYVEWLCSHMLPLIKRRKLADFADIRCEEGGFSVEQAGRYLTSARELGFGLKIQTQRSQAGAIRAAVELGAINVTGAIDISSDDALLLAQSHTVATLLPGQGFYLGTHAYSPARMLIDSGAAVSLATGYNAETSPSQSMQMMIALACRNMNMTPAEAVTAATFNAAHGLRRSSSIGSLESGKSADLIILSVPDYREIPYHFGVNLVELVMKNGAALVERSEVKWPAP